MAIVTYPLNNISYSAEDAELFHCTRTSGVFAADEDFNATVTGTNNVVTIGQGIAWIRNSKFSGKVVANKAAVSVDMGLANGTYNRIDAIVLQFSASGNKTSIIRKQGTASTSPQAPSVTQTESVYELHLYHVYRRAGATSIVESDITDLRANRDYCGVMSDDVTMLGDDFISQDMIGVANGVASLNSSGKVPTDQLPSMNYIPTSKRGAANGVAPLNSSRKIDSTYLPTMNYIPTSQKGVANGVASLGSDGKVPTSQLPSMQSDEITHGFASVSSFSGGASSATVSYAKVGSLVTVSMYVDLSGSITSSNQGSFLISGLPKVHTSFNNKMWPCKARGQSGASGTEFVTATTSETTASITLSAITVGQTDGLYSGYVTATFSYFTNPG